MLNSFIGKTSNYVEHLINWSLVVKQVRGNIIQNSNKNHNPTVVLILKNSKSAIM